MILSGSPRLRAPRGRNREFRRPRWSIGPTMVVRATLSFQVIPKMKRSVMSIQTRRAPDRKFWKSGGFSLIDRCNLFDRAVIVSMSPPKTTRFSPLDTWVHFRKPLPAPAANEFTPRRTARPVANRTGAFRVAAGNVAHNRKGAQFRGPTALFDSGTGTIATGPALANDSPPYRREVSPARDILHITTTLRPIPRLRARRT